MELLIEKRRRRCYVWCAYLLSGLFFDHTYVLARKIGAVHRKVTDGEQANALQVSDGTSLVHGNNVPTEESPKKEGGQNLALLIVLGIVGPIVIYMMFQKLTSNSVEDELKEAAKTLDEAEGKYNTMKGVLEDKQNETERLRERIEAFKNRSDYKKTMANRVKAIKERVESWNEKYSNFKVKTGSKKKVDKAIEAFNKQCNKKNLEKGLKKDKKRSCLIKGFMALIENPA